MSLRLMKTAGSIDLSQATLMDKKLRKDFLTINREAFAKSDALSKGKKNRVFKGEFADSFLGNFGIGAGRKQAHHFTHQLKQMDSHYETKIAKIESDGVKAGKTKKDILKESNAMRLERIEMAMDVYTQSGESLSAENKTQLRKMMVSDGKHMGLLADAFQTRMRDGDFGADGPRTGSIKWNVLKGFVLT